MVCYGETDFATDFLQFYNYLLIGTTDRPARCRYQFGDGANWYLAARAVPAIISGPAGTRSAVYSTRSTASGPASDPFPQKSSADRRQPDQGRSVNPGGFAARGSFFAAFAKNHRLVPASGPSGPPAERFYIAKIADERCGAATNCGKIMACPHSAAHQKNSTKVKTREVHHLSG